MLLPRQCASCRRGATEGVRRDDAQRLARGLEIVNLLVCPAPGLGGAIAKEDNVLSLADFSAHNDAADRSGIVMAETKLNLTSEELLAEILSSLDDDKAEDIVQIDLRGKSEMADYMIVASGRSTRQVVSIADKLVERLKQDHGVLSKVEGKDGGDWVLIDTGDAIVHVFRPEVREFYQLEKMWLSPEQAAARY